jgi:transcriptional regulator with PAS, ATPase and Fis domain
VIEIVALSDAMREVIRLAERVAATDANVLITGESGAGKDALASLIHSRSKRSNGAMVKIDCAALPSELLEAEFFGYERGAFTGATDARPGRFEAAHGGTLILDEIAHLPVEAQAKLLRVIEEREFERLGGRRTIKVDARLIALTNVDLDEAVKRRSFREDLFFRLNVMRLHVPPLRERVTDIETLARSFVKTYASKHGRDVTGLTAETLAILNVYSWPGNVRELSNIIERAVILAGEARIQAADLPEALRAAVLLQERAGQRQTLAELEADYVAEMLAATGGNKTEAARLLGISRKNLYEKLARYGIVGSGQWAVGSKNKRAKQP